MNSWKATGLVQPVWKAWAERHGIRRGARDAFAEAIGTKGPVLSSLNTGDANMTRKMATRIAEEGEVSVLELGAPEEAARVKDKPILDRLRELEVAVALQRKLLLEGFGLLGLQVETGADPASLSVQRTQRAPQGGGSR